MNGQEAPPSLRALAAFLLLLAAAFPPLAAELPVALLGALLGTLPVAEGPATPVEEPPQPPPRLVIDVRDPADHAAGHLPGALNIQLGWDQLEQHTRGYVPDLETPVAVVAEDEDDAEEALEVLRDQGYVDVVVHRPSPADPAPVVQPTITARELRDVLRTRTGAYVLDVRSKKEQARGMVPSAAAIPPEAAAAAVASFPRDASYYVICEEGWRSGQLTSWMLREGFTDVTHVIDGMKAWRDL